MAERTVTVRLRAAADQFRQTMGAAASDTEKVAKRGEQLQRVGGQMTKRVTLPLMGVAGAAAAVGLQFESSMNRVEAVSGAGQAKVAEMTETVRDLGSTTQFSANQAADAMGFLTQAGFDANEAMEALPATLDLAAAGQMELARTADLASNVLQQFALEADEMGRVADVLAAASSNANTSVEQMGQAMSFAGPVAQAAGISLEQTAAAVGVLSDAGIQASRAGTSLRMSMSRLLSPTGEAADLIDELGLNATTADGKLRPLNKIVGQLERSSADAGDMMQLFGQRAGPSMLALVEQGQGALESMTATMEKSGGTAERMADTQMQGLTGSVKELRSAAEELALTLFDSLKPRLEATTDTVTDLVRAASDAPAPLVNTGVAIGGIAAASGPTLWAVGALARAYGPAIDKTQQLTGASTRLRGVMRGGLAIGAVTFAVSELADGFIEGRRRGREMVDEIVERSDTAQQAIAELDATMQDVLREDVAQQGIGEAIATGATGAFGAIKRLGGTIDDLTRAWELWTAQDDVGSRFAEDTGAAASLAADKVDNLTAATLGVAEGFDNQVGPTREAAAEIEATEDAADRLAAELGHTVDASDEAASAADRLSDAWDRLAGNTISVERALIAYEEHVDSLDDKLEGNERRLDTHTESGRKNISALLDGIDAARDHAEAMLDDGASTEDAAAATQSHVEDLIDQFNQLGFTREEIERYIGELGLVPDEVGTQIVAEVDGARAALSDVERQLDAIRAGAAAEVRVGTVGLDSAGIRHAGGAVGSAGPTRRLHTGGAATAGTSSFGGLRDNERMMVLEKSEHVLTGEQMGVLQGMFGSRGGGQAQPTEQHVDRSVQVGQVVAHDYDDFVSQMSQRQRVAALQGGRR